MSTTNDLLKEIYSDSKDFGKEVYGDAQIIGTVSSTFKMIISGIISFIFLIISLNQFFSLYNQKDDLTQPPKSYMVVYICFTVFLISGLYTYYLYMVSKSKTYQAGEGLSVVKNLF